MRPRAEEGVLYDWYNAQKLRRQREDVDFYRRRASELGARRLLELGCGTGRITIPLAEQDWSVVGIDFSPSMLRRARSKSEGKPRRPRWIEADIARLGEFELGEPFDLVLIPYSAFQLLSPEDRLGTLWGVARHLRPGGRLLMDISPNFTSTEEQLDAHVLTAESRELEGVVACYGTVRQRSMEVATEFEDRYEVFHYDGSRESAILRERYYTLFTDYVTQLLDRAKLAVETVYGGYDGRPLGARAYKRIYEATSSQMAGEQRQGGRT